MRLGRTLQSQGVEIALSEMIDASSAAAAIDLGSRSQLREALRATLIKHPRHYDRFDAAFERLFPARPAGQRPTGGGAEPGDLATLISRGGDLEAAAAALVDDLAGLDGDVRGERHHLQRVLRGADLARLLSDARRLDPSQSTEELRARIEQLKRLITAEVRAHLGDVEEPDATADLADIEFLNASRTQLDDMRAAVRPLARKLASRLGRRRRIQRAGKIHLRRTTRRSLGTGGVPLDVVHHRPRNQRPELFVLCDISGSVAEFAVFTLTLMASLSAEVASSRSFVFVDAIDEVTDLLSRTGHGIEPWQILRNTNVIGAEGHSDYGAVLEQFWDRVGRTDLRPSSTVIITGDGRCNYRPPRDDLLAMVARRARRVYWLNPEPRAEWDTHDSEISTYGRHVADVFEVRNLRQLVDCVEQVL